MHVFFLGMTACEAVSVFRTCAIKTVEADLCVHECLQLGCNFMSVKLCFEKEEKSQFMLPVCLTEEN